MSIRDLEESKEMRECFSKIGGREGISKRVIEICKLVAEKEDYKYAIFAMGRMARLMQAAKYDSYWTEKAERGKEREYYAVLQAAKNGGDFSKAVDAFGDEKL